MTSTVASGLAKPFHGFGGFVAMSLDTFRAMGKRPFALGECVEQMWFIIRVSIFPTLLVMLGFTLVVIFQFNLLLSDLGALDLSGGLAGVAVVQQIGPFVTVVVVAGAAGTAVCSDLSARAIREELDGMKVLGVDPIQRLVVPRVVAAVVVVQALNFVIITGGLIGGYFFSVYLQGAAPGAYVDTVSLLTGTGELVFAVVKGFVFGLVAALIACYRALIVSGGSKGVGEAVNQAVVVTIAVLVPVDLMVSLIQFAVLG